MSFRITGLPVEHFAELFSLSDEELAVHGVVRRIADHKPYYPCRISLTDAEPGQEVLLVNYEHLPVDTPYRSRYAIYVRRDEQTYDAIDQVPQQLRLRLLAVRAFDKGDMLVDADVVDGRELEGSITRLFVNPRASYLHIHYAKAGCYAARVDRVM